ncbi:MAG: ABC transporter permease [Armatimonadetes bacterium]|nr:ABC transporter permease [Armatimonadota bacterium]MDW8123056.1 ABC transporter permease [Armatimonadota bacterium]
MVTRSLFLIIVWLLLVAFFSALTPGYLTVNNLLGMTRHLTEVGIMSIGMTLLLIAGTIDLSVASQLALASIVLGWTYRWGCPIELSIVLALMTGMTMGSLNGLFVAFLRFPAVVVTLATMALFRGLAMGLTGGAKVSGFPDGLIQFGQGQIFFIPYPLFLFGAIALLAGFALHRTVWGRYLFAIGAGETAARFSGVPVNGIRFSLFVLSGLCSGLASVVYVARFNTAKADAAMAAEMDVITAALLGGTPLTGGTGTLLGTIVGLLLLSSLRRGLDLMVVGTEQQAVIIGAILIVAVAAGQVSVSFRRLLPLKRGKEPEGVL